jgi:hypothetical protein
MTEPTITIFFRRQAEKNLGLYANKIAKTDFLQERLECFLPKSKPTRRVRIYPKVRKKLFTIFFIIKII